MSTATELAQLQARREQIRQLLDDLGEGWSKKQQRHDLVSELLFVEESLCILRTLPPEPAQGKVAPARSAPCSCSWPSAAAPGPARSHCPAHWRKPIKPAQPSRRAISRSPTSATQGHQRPRTSPSLPRMSRARQDSSSAAPSPRRRECQ